MNSLIIVGASGHGKVVADIARRNGYSDIAFLDDAPGLMQVSSYQVLGAVPQFEEYLQSDFVVAIGNAAIRRRIQDELTHAGAKFVTLIHPSAIITEDVVIGAGSVVMAGAVINPSARIGRGCIVNTSASIDHDCIVGNFAHVSVGAHLAGTVSVGDGTWVGIGSVVSNNISICSDCMIGAGAVVVKDIQKPGTYIGVPARLHARTNAKNRGGK